MNKKITINPLAVLLFFAIIGAIAFSYLYKIDALDINLAVFIIGLAALLIIGAMSFISLKNKRDNPALAALLKTVLLVLTGVFVLFAVGSIMIAMAMS